MKALKITYWVSTAIVSGIFTITSYLYMTHSPVMVAKTVALGYPLFLLNILGLAKILGSLTLIIPKLSSRLKEWAYAGFVFDLIGAIWSHLVVQGAIKALPPVLPLAIVLVSYISWRLLNRSLPA